MSWEKKLAQALKRGDGDEVWKVCSEIFDEYHRLVFAVSYQILGDREDAEDASQEAFVSFFSKLDSQKEFSSIKYYLLSSARFISYRIKREKETREEEFPEERLGFSEDITKRLDESQAMQALQASLTEEEFALVLEHVLEEKTFREIAEERGVSENSISSKYKRTLDKARKALER